METGKRVGIPRYSWSATKKLDFSLKDGHNVYRILPPYGSLVEDGIWAVYEAIHWGYVSSKGKRTFRCIQRKDSRTKMISTVCPECEYINQIKANYEKQFKELVEIKKVPVEKAKKMLEVLAEEIKDHNLDKRWYLNAINDKGEMGRLSIRHTAYVSLQNAIKDLVEQKESTSPISAEDGVFFDFKREKIDSKTQYSVIPATEIRKLDSGERANIVKRSQLTEFQLQQMENSCWDLKDMQKNLTYDEIKRLVDSKGDVNVVDSIFLKPEVSTVSSIEEDPEPEACVAKINVSVPVVENKPIVKPAVEPVDEKAQLKAKLKAQLEALEKTESSNTISDKEFVQLFGNKDDDSDIPF